MTLVSSYYFSLELSERERQLTPKCPSASSNPNQVAVDLCRPLDSLLLEILSTMCPYITLIALLFQALTTFGVARADAAADCSLPLPCLLVMA